MPCIRNYLVLPIGISTGSNSDPLPWSQNALGRIEMRQNDTKHTMQQGTEMRDALPLFCWNAPDMEFFWLVLLLTTIGLIMLLSASYPTAYYEQGYPYFYFARQLILAVIGILLMIGISFINCEYFRVLGKPLIIISLLLLAVVLIPGIGIVRNHAQRWLSIFGLFNFQPSEIAKLAVVLEFSSSISVKHRQMRTFMNTCKCAALMFAKYKNMFANIFANILTFTNYCDRIRTDKQRGHEHGQPYLLLRQSIKQRAKP